MPDLLGLLPLLQPSPDAPRGLDPEDVSPGVEGFIATGLVVGVVVLLILSLVGRLRRLRHRAEVEAQSRADAQPRTDPPGEPSADRPGPTGEHPDQPDRAGERHLE